MEAWRISDGTTTTAKAKNNSVDYFICLFVERPRFMRLYAMPAMNPSRFPLRLAALDL